MAMDLDSILQFIEREESFGGCVVHGEEIAQLRREVAELRECVGDLGTRVTLLEVAPLLPPAPPSTCDDGPGNGANGGDTGKDGSKHVHDASGDVGGASGSMGSTHFDNAVAKEKCIGLSITGLSEALGSKSPGQQSHDDTQYYSFRDSVWDAVLFVFTEPMGIAGSLFVLLLAVACSVMQLLFVLIVIENFTDTNFSNASLRNFLAWRVSVAHNANHLDLVSFTSLASRVCEASEADGLNVGVRQAIALEAINSYIPKDGGAFGGHPGELMCCLAVMVWLMSVTKELRQILNLRKTIISLLARGCVSSGSLVRSGTSWGIDRLSKPRVVLAVLSVIYRTIVAIVLMISGIFYLVHTIDMTELLLNAVSLELVLVVDELLYEALAPAQTWSFIRSLRPVPMKSGYRWQGLDCRVVSLTGLVILSIFATFWWPLSQEVERLHEARDILCGGELDFVYVRSAMPPFIQYASSLPYSSDVSGYLSETILNIIHKSTPEEAAYIKVPALTGSAWSLDLISRWDVAEATVRYGQGCQDFSDHQGGGGFNPNLTIRAVRWELQNESLSDCDGAHQYCNSDTIRGTYTRQLCPITCGCHRPESFLLLAHRTSGCPLHCLDHAEYREAMATRSCVDRPKEELLANPEYVVMANAFLGLRENWPTPVHALLTGIRTILLEHGCGAVPLVRESLNIDLCDPEAMALRSLTFRCPQACNCTAGNPLCPRSC